MTKLIDKAIAHFNDKAVIPLDIPEWGVTVYGKVVSMDEKSKWLIKANEDTTDYMIYAIIGGIVDEDGNAVFDIGDKHSLRHQVDPEIIAKMSNLVLHTGVQSDEEREKN